METCEEVLVYDSDYFQNKNDTVEIRPTYIKKEWSEVPSKETYDSWVSEVDNILKDIYNDS